MTVIREGTGTRWLLSGASAVLVLVGLILAAVLALSVGQPSPALADQSIETPQTVGSLSVSPDDICKEGITGEWHFVINQVDAQVNAPASIEVTFDDGHPHTVNLDPGTGSPVAQYTLTTHLTNTLLEATAVIYNGWEGRFVVSHTPCVVPTPTPTPTPTPAPTLAPTATPAPTPTAVLPAALPPTGGGPVGAENSFASLALLLVAAALMLGGVTMAVALSRKRPS